MRIYYTCPHCKKEITINSWASDRFILARKLGEIFPQNCKTCGSRVVIHVNDVKADENKLKNIMIFVFAIIESVLLFFWHWDYIFGISKYGAAIAIGMIFIPHYTYKQLDFNSRGNVDYFNKKLYR